MSSIDLAGVSFWPADDSSPVLESTVGSVLREATAVDPEATAMVAHRPGGGRDSWTFGELLDDAEAVAVALLERFEPGERVAVWAPNLPEWVVLEFGAGLAGVILVTVNPAYQAAELAYVLNHSGAVGIFLTPEFRSPMLEILNEVRPEVPALREVVLFTEWSDFLGSGDPNRELPHVDPSDLAQIQYTSGTTGFPKGAELHHRGLTNNARFYAERLGVRPGEVYVNPMPLFHTAGCAMGVLGAIQTRGIHVPVFAFDPAAVLDIIAAECAEVTGGVPTMLIAMLATQQAQPRDLSNLRLVMSGGSPVPADLVRRVEAEFDARFSIVFGTTECSPLITQIRPDLDGPETRATTLGAPLPQVDVMVADPATAKPVAVGELGELCARGYQVMRGYHDNPEATHGVIDDDGWYHTGDLASMSANGYLRIEGRLKDMIIRGGENIYPREIEDVLFSHPAIAEVAVVGIPDPTWGEIVAAAVRLNADASISDDELKAFCREHLAPYKTPVIWERMEAFPMTASGKIQKFKLRETLTARL